MVTTTEMPTREVYVNIKSAIRRRDPRSAVGRDVETPALVKALYDNYSLDPLQAFLERAIIVVSHANKSTL